MKGDFAKLAKLIQSSGEAAGGAFVARSVVGLGRIAQSLAVQGASAARAPSGQRWKNKKGGGQALRSIAASIRVVVSSRGVKLQSTKPWAGFHQKGASKRGTKWRLPIRRILPKKALPKKWMEPMLREIEAQWLKTWKR
jgi:hypothetical protein